MRKIAKDALKHSDEYKRAPGEVRLPPHGYNKAKAKLQAEDHHFERARREFGFEFGVFVDGALMEADSVMALAEMLPQDRLQWIARERLAWKDQACNAVAGYMRALNVSHEEMLRHLKSRRE